MTESQNDGRNRLLQGVDPSAGAPLAEEEGVNAASAEATQEKSGSGGADVTAGGRPEDAPDPAGGLTGYGATKDDTELVGTPGDDSREPSEQHGSSGQDSGSMD